MNDKQRTIYNAITAVIILAVIFLFWFFLREQFAWAVILAILLIVLAVMVNARKKLPWEGIDVYDGIVAIGSIAILGFAWFYMKEQFMWAIIAVVLFVLLAELLKHWRKSR